MRESLFGIYVHWPFCLSKCPYCDFNSHVAAGIDQRQWQDALLAELAHFAARTGPERRVGSIFFGGGTPSLMAPATAARIIEATARHWDLAPDAEITLEANPGTVDLARFADFREAGINRLSLGVQALDDSVLRFLGRRHDLGEAIRAIEAARAIFPRLSFDLIYARPGQAEADWRHELSLALALAADHLSLYQLTIEPGTAFFPAHERGDFALPDEDGAARLYDVTQEMSEAAGLYAYEISNHARPGAECRGNLLYWQGGDYVGIGPGAHGRLGGIGDGPGPVLALRQHRAPQAWLDAVAARGHGTAEETPLTGRERIEELVMMGLRLVEGIDEARFLARTGTPLEDALDGKALGDLMAEGLLARPPGRLQATREGRLLLNGLTAALLG